MQNVGHARPGESARVAPAKPGGRLTQLSLGLKMDLATAAPAVALPANIEAEVIALLAEAIRIVHEEGEEVDHAEHDEQ